MMAKIKMPGMVLSDLLSGFTLHDPVPALQIFDIASNSAPRYRGFSVHRAPPA